MKKLFILLSLVLLTLFACIKPDKPYFEEDPVSGCRSSKFQVNINSTLIPCSGFFKNPNFFILGEDQGVTKVLKLDSIGDIVWEKSFPNISGTASSIIVLNNNEPVIVTKENDMKIPLSTTSFSNVWVQNGYIDYPTCQPFYELGSSDSSFRITSKTNIVCLNVDGSIKWSKSLDHSFGGNNCLQDFMNTDIMVVTMKIQGKVPDFVYDANGVFQDTVNYSMDSNMVYITDYTLSGAQLWQIVVPNVFNNSYTEMRPNLSFGFDHNYFVKSAKDLIEVTTNGYIMNRERLDSIHCAQSATSMIKDSDVSLISGWYKEIDTTTGISQDFNYIKRTDKGKTWTINSKDILIAQSNDRFVTISEDSTQISVYDLAGSLKWSYACSKPVTCGFNCAQGLFIAEQINGVLQITNTDIDGNY